MVAQKSMKSMDNFIQNKRLQKGLVTKDTFKSESWWMS